MLVANAVAFFLLCSFYRVCRTGSEVSASVQFNFSTPELDISEGEDLPSQLSIVKTGQHQGSITVNVTLTSAFLNQGDYTVNQDQYVFTNEILTLPIGIQLVGDRAGEPIESFNLTLAVSSQTSTSISAAIIFPSKVTVVIIDDDSVVIGFSDDDSSVAIIEGGPSQTICLEVKEEGLPLDPFDTARMKIEIDSEIPGITVELGTNQLVFLGVETSLLCTTLSVEENNITEGTRSSHIFISTGESTVPIEVYPSRIPLIVLDDVNITCDAETTLYENFTYSWPRTLGGETASLICPTRSNVLVMRNCGSDGLWQTVADDGCDSVNEQLNQLNESFANLTTETYGDSVAVLSQIIALTENNTNEQTNEVLSTTANYFEELADFVNESNVIINITVIEDIVQVVNSLLQWEPVNIMIASSSSLVESFEIVVSTYAQQLSLNETQNFTTLSLTLVAELRSVDSLSQSGRSFLIGDTDVMLGSEDQVEPGQLPAQLDTAIRLPASLFEQIDDRSNVGVFFAFYETPTLFSVGGESNSLRPTLPSQTAVGSDIIAATVGPGITFQNLDEPVTIVFRLQVPEGNFIAEGNETCVSWDFTHRDWTTEGCTTIIGEGGVVTCNCNHLTNFAVLVDICLRQEDCERSRVDQALTYISYIGTSISIVCLVFTLLTILVFKKIREKDIFKYHIQLCLALLCMYMLILILVVFSAERVDTIYGGCVSLSLLVHYFTLVAVMWMGAEALLMFQKFVIVFVRITTKFVIIISTICWTVPIVFVLVPFIVDLANGHHDASDIVIQQAEMEDDISYCFLSHIGALVGTVLAPIFMVITVNLVFFIWVIVVVIRHAKKKADQMKQTITNREILRITLSISGILFLFGLTWSFFILTFSAPGLRETFQILFTLFNSLQGFFIFAFILFTEGFGYWKAILSCEKYKSKLAQVSIPGTKSSATPSALSRQNKNTSEASQNDKTTEMYNEKLELKELHFSSRDIDSPTRVIGVDTSSSVKRIDKLKAMLQHQLQNDQQCIKREQQDLGRDYKKRTVMKMV